MKKYSAILDMFYGRRGNIENVRVEGEKIEGLLDVLIEKSEKLEKKLKETPEIFKLYKEVQDAIDKLHDEETDEYYTEGFRFGVLLGMDVMKGI
ncbi:MAG: hypothetical protein IKA72_03165 [Clostridia bacterium]|nr:hypothetical protein [Clostridia bacterium]